MSTAVAFRGTWIAQAFGFPSRREAPAATVRPVRRPPHPPRKNTRPSASPPGEEPRDELRPRNLPLRSRRSASKPRWRGEQLSESCGRSSSRNTPKGVLLGRAGRCRVGRRVRDLDEERERRPRIRPRDEKEGRRPWPGGPRHRSYSPSADSTAKNTGLGWLVEGGLVENGRVS
jgi:hypothetical protein